MSMLSERNSKASNSQKSASNQQQFDIYDFNQKNQRHERANHSAIEPRTAKLTSAKMDSQRPMTSVRTAGYTSRGRTPSSANRFQGSTTTERITITSEDKSKDLEKAVHQLVLESCIATQQGNQRVGLEKAKEAAQKERQIAKQKESSTDTLNLDLTFVVLMNLANQYQVCKMYPEALNVYSAIVKNKSFAQSGRLRVNMGNIYYEQQDYLQAIKMYRMALDQIPASLNTIRQKILKNISNAFIQLKQYQEAASSLEVIAEAGTDALSIFHLIIIYFALGDKERMKKAFQKLLALKSLPIEVSKMEEDIIKSDQLRALAMEKKRDVERRILLAARLIAPTIDDTLSNGYQWVVSAIKSSPHADIASELEIAKSIEYLKSKDFELAIETLKSFENKDGKLLGAAATNLSFLYFLDGDMKQSQEYAQMAISHDHYNSKAHCNLGNVYYQAGNMEMAKKHYDEAIGLDAVCIESMYNLGLLHKQLRNDSDALIWFEKLHSILSNSSQVIYHIADIHERQGNVKVALEWYNVLLSVVPTDPGILARIANLYETEGNKAQAHHYYTESFRYFPSSVPVIQWLANYYMECQVYEHALAFLEKATLMEPNQVLWYLKIADCHRKSGNYQVAFEHYKPIHPKFPENVECLRYLVRIATDLAMPVAADYASLLVKSEANQAIELPKENVKAAKVVHANAMPKEEWNEDVTQLLPE